MATTAANPVPFPEIDEDDAIGKWLLTLTSAQREKIFRLVAYLNPPKTRRTAKRESAGEARGK